MVEKIFNEGYPGLVLFDDYRAANKSKIEIFK